MEEGLFLSPHALICLFRRGFVEGLHGRRMGADETEMHGDRGSRPALAAGMLAAMWMVLGGSGKTPSSAGFGENPGLLWGVKRRKGQSRGLTAGTCCSGTALSVTAAAALQTAMLTGGCGAWPSSGSPAAAIDAQVFLGP